MINKAIPMAITKTSNKKKYSGITNMHDPKINAKPLEIKAYLGVSMILIFLFLVKELTKFLANDFFTAALILLLINRL
jgi:hypothetical protein